MRVTDRQVREVIRTLEADAGGAVSGARVRAELARQHGARGGVARVYRILAEARGEARSEDARQLVQRVRQLEESLAVMTRRAEIAEQREIAHQDKAALEIDALRQRVRELQSSPAVVGVKHEDYLKIYREVVALRRRVVALEGEGGAG